MDKDTKSAAIFKLQKMNFKIGAPTKFPSYEYSVGPEYFQNKLNAYRYNTKEEAAKYGEKKDNTLWGMPVSAVNAYYSPMKNEMVFPAGVLQPPFFHEDLPMPLNYASIGSVIGHEMTHGYDNSGSNFDGNGRRKEWWSKPVRAKFKIKAECFVNQYDRMQVPGLPSNYTVDGKLTLGENIADNGGVTISFRAYKRYAKEFGSTKAYDLGDRTVTDEALFWLGWGQSWCNKKTRPALLYQLQSDEHSPGFARVNGVVMNLQKFSESFECKKGDAMRPAGACSLW